MAISTDNILTWQDFANTCLNAIKSVCCNVDNVNTVPSYLRSGTATVRLSTTTPITYKVPQEDTGDTRTTYYYGWNAVPKSGLISAVAASTINSEWNTFLSAAGINSRSNQLISAKEFTLAVGLYMQFMSYHVQPVFFRGQIYGQNNQFKSNKYVTGTLTPTYTLSAVTESNASISDSDLTNIVNRNFNASQLMRHHGRTTPYYCQIAGAGQV